MASCRVLYAGYASPGIAATIGFISDGDRRVVPDPGMVPPLGHPGPAAAAQGHARAGDRRGVQPPPHRPHPARGAVPQRRFHDHWAIYADDQWRWRDADGCCVGSATECCASSRRTIMGNPQATEEYLSALPAAQAETLRSLRDTIRAAAPDAQETISSGVPALKYRNKYLIGYGAAKAHVSLFVMRGAALKRLEEELMGYDTSNTVIRFTPDNPLPAPIVQKIIKLRIAEIDAPEGA